MIVCAGVGLLQVALALASRHLQRPAVLAPRPRVVAAWALALIAAVCIVGVAAGAPRWVDERWQEFAAPSSVPVAAAQDTVFNRLSAANGNGRHEFWESALDAKATDPLKGIGPGTFEFWWSRNGTTPGFIRDAHSLYFETLAETGIVGEVLLGGLLLFLLLAAIARSLRAAPVMRVWIAASVGGLAAFMTSAAFEWVWEIGAVACAVMLLAAVIVAGRDAGEVVASRDEARRRVLPRALLALLAVAALGAVAVPMAGALATRDSRDDAADGRLGAALQASRSAERLQPYAATPRLQRALVLEAAGALSSAAAAAKAAKADEPTNWRTWFVLARIDARRGHADAAVGALRTAKHLNPRSPLLAGS